MVIVDLQADRLLDQTARLEFVRIDKGTNQLPHGVSFRGSRRALLDTLGRLIKTHIMADLGRKKVGAFDGAGQLGDLHLWLRS